MARPIWSGSISFGLVNIPVSLISATNNETIDLDLLRKEDLSPIRYRKVAESDGKEVSADDIVRGYKVSRGEYVVLSNEDFQKVDRKRTGTIELISFTGMEEVDSIYYEKPYYLEPKKGAEKAYQLLERSLKDSGKVGIAKFVLRTREHLGVIRSYNSILILDQLRYGSDIRPPEISLRTTEKINEKEELIATKLIDEMTEHFEPEKYHDTYKEVLLDAIQEKKERGTFTPKGEEPTPTDFTNLMAELKRSLTAAQAKKNEQ